MSYLGREHAGMCILAGGKRTEQGTQDASSIFFFFLISPGNAGEGKEVFNRISMVEISYLPKSCAGQGGGKL